MRNTGSISLSQAIQQALAFAQAGRVTEAEGLLARILKAAPGHADALQLMGMAKRRRGRSDEAEQFFRRSLKANPAQPHVHNNLGNVLSDAGRFDEAVEAYRVAVTLKADYADAWLNLGLALLHRQAFDDSRDAIESALRHAPQSAKAWTALGNVHKAQEDFGPGITAYERALAIQPDYVNALHNCGVAHKMAGRPARGLMLIDKALACASNRAEIHYNRGNALHDLGRIDEAVEAYERASLLQPDYLDAHDTLNKLLWQYGRTERYLSSYRNAIEKVPQSVGLWSAWAEKLRLAGRPADAERVANHATSLGLNSAQLYYRLAQAQADQGQHEAAVSNYRQAADMSTDTPLFRLGAATSLLIRRRAEEALEESEKALAVDPFHQKAHALRGVAWRLLGDPREKSLNDYRSFVQPVTLPAPPGYESIAAFNRRLADVLARYHRTKTHPDDQTLRHGTQSLVSLFKEPVTEIQSLKRLIRDAVRSYIDALPDDGEHILLGRKSGGFRFSGSWTVKLNDQGYHTNHVHPEGWISSAYYVALPDCVQADDPEHQGWIRFGWLNPPMPQPDKPGRVICPHSGMLVLFPSYMWHGTVPFRSPQPRLTVAFDVVPE